MEYKGINRIYFGIGIKPYYQSFDRLEFYFYFFKLIQRKQEGEMLKRGRDYKGFLINKNFRLPCFGINF